MNLFIVNGLFAAPASQTNRCQNQITFMENYFEHLLQNISATTLDLAGWQLDDSVCTLEQAKEIEKLRDRYYRLEDMINGICSSNQTQVKDLCGPIRLQVLSYRKALETCQSEQQKVSQTNFATTSLLAVGGMAGVFFIGVGVGATAVVVVGLLCKRYGCLKFFNSRNAADQVAVVRPQADLIVAQDAARAVVNAIVDAAVDAAARTVIDAVDDAANRAQSSVADDDDAASRAQSNVAADDDAVVEAEPASAADSVGENSDAASPPTRSRGSAGTARATADLSPQAMARVLKAMEKYGDQVKAVMLEQLRTSGFVEKAHVAGTLQWKWKSLRAKSGSIPRGWSGDDGILKEGKSAPTYDMVVSIERMAQIIIRAIERQIDAQYKGTTPTADQIKRAVESATRTIFESDFLSYFEVTPYHKKPFK